MGVTQFFINLENIPGSLADISSRLGYAGINIRGISVFAKGSESLLHLVVNDPVGAERVFKEGGITFAEERVLAIVLPDIPGSLAICAKSLADADINIEYLYPFMARTPNAIVIIKTDKIDQTEEVLVNQGIKMLTEEELYMLE